MGAANEITGAAPAARAIVGPLVEPHLPKFSQVLREAWGSYAEARRLAPGQMLHAGASARGMLVSDFTREPAHRIFSQVADASVDDLFGRPWISFASGTVRVRFRKLTADLGLCPSGSERALSLAYHLGDPCLPGMEAFTVLTAGYVLDAAEENIERLALVCHSGFTDVYYALPLPLGPTKEFPTTVAGPAQLPLAPLSRPIIRSAQAAAVKRLHTGSAAAGDRDV